MDIRNTEKKKLVFIAFSIFIIITVVCFLIFSGIGEKYTVYGPDFNIGKPKFNTLCNKCKSRDISTFAIGTQSYNVEMTSCGVYGVTEEEYCVLKVINGNEHLSTNITINPESGQVYGFLNITPFPAIEGIDQISDEQLAERVQEQLRGFADFSRYNDFESSKSQTGTYTLTWRVVKKLPCSTYLSVWVDTDGRICYFSFVENCRDSFGDTFLSDDDRDRLIEKAICRYYSIRELGNKTFRIESATLGNNKGKDMITYLVSIEEYGCEVCLLFSIIKNY